MASSVIGPQEGRYAFIHILRGVAAMLVVWSHLSGFWLLEHGKTSAAQDLWYQFVVRPLHLYQNGGHLGVIIFFLISGFIITHTSLRETRRSFAIRRVLRIFPPLILAILISWLAVQVAVATDTRLIGVDEEGSPLRWLAATLLLDGWLPGGRVLDVTWTLVVELLFYALTFALIGFSKTRPIAATWVMIGVWVALSVAFLNVFGDGGPQNRSSIYYVGFLLAGRAIYLWHRKLVRGIDAVFMAGLPIMIYCLIVEAITPGYLIAPGGWTGLEPVLTYVWAVVVFMLMLSLSPARSVQPFTLIGDVSYSLYLLHIPVGITVLNLLDRVGVPETVNSVLAVAASIGVSTASYYAVEKPFQRLARRLTPRPAPPPDPDHTAAPAG